MHCSHDNGLITSINSIFSSHFKYTSLFPGSNALSISARTSMIPRAFCISDRLAKENSIEKKKKKSSVNKTD